MVHGLNTLVALNEQANERAMQSRCSDTDVETTSDQDRDAAVTSFPATDADVLGRLYEWVHCEIDHSTKAKLTLNDWQAKLHASRKAVFVEVMTKIESLQNEIRNQPDG